jgi:hypothetical protein
MKNKNFLNTETENLKNNWSVKFFRIIKMDNRPDYFENNKILPNSVISMGL